MRKKSIFALTLFFFLASAILCTCNADNKVDSYEQVFCFPNSLETIENEAFEGSAVRMVVFDDNIRFIGENAFTGSVYLADIYLPSGIDYIADFAFPRNERLTIHGAAGSYAEQWAVEHNIAFLPENIPDSDNDSDHSEGIELPIIWFGLLDIQDIKRKIKKRIRNGTESKRPQDRAELRQINLFFP